MKKYFYYIIAACFLFTFCSKEEKEKEEKFDTRGRTPRCSTPLYVLSVFVKEESADYALFFKNIDQIDKESIYFFKKINGNQVQYKFPLEIDFCRDSRTIRIAAFEPIELFTGEKETFYLRNKAKTYKMDLLGIYGSVKMVQLGREYNCGYYFELDEVYINDVKREVEEERGVEGIFLD